MSVAKSYAGRLNEVGSLARGLKLVSTNGSIGDEKTQEITNGQINQRKAGKSYDLACVHLALFASYRIPYHTSHGVVVAFRLSSL